jgi:hypothetical protein
MIEAGWDVLARDFDEIAILEWRKEACEFLTDLLGCDHAYARNLGDKSSKASETKVLSGIGVLGAAQESLFNGIVPLGSFVSV